MIPTEDFNGMVGVDDDLSHERLLFYAFPGLKTIASGSNDDARQWLRSVLSNAADTPEKRTLTDLLGRH